MDKKTVSLILKALRSSTLRWHIRNDVIKESKVKVHIGYFKNGNRKYKVMHKCNVCGGLYEKIQVDHIEEVGQYKGDLHCYASRMFCDKSNLQAICKSCHDVKTNEYKEYRESGAHLL